MVLELLAAVHLIARACHPVSLPAQVTVEDDCQKTEHSAGFTSCSFGDQRFADRLNHFMEQRLREAAQYDDDDEPKGGVTCEGEQGRQYHFGVSCEAPYARGNIISFGCASWWDSGAHPDGEPFGINLEVTRQGFRELELKDVLVSEPAAARLWDLVRADLQRQGSEICGYGKSGTNEWFAGQLAKEIEKYAGFYFSKAGLVITYDHWAFGHCILEGTVSYARLNGVLKPAILRPPNDRRAE
ncbi:MAG TPA: hypothetical protein VLC46_15625 [Thermoanaerobaculia bacterium]|jgi:hypothetical protein|nr:hypothetical protein [Thermoanaerobaculia bacterium]